MNWTTFDPVSPATLVIILTTLLVVVAYYFLRSSDLPPGPTGLPFIGYYPFLDHQNINLQFDNLKKKYGDVFSFRVTGTLFINLGTVKALREAHISKSDCFTQRSENFNLLNALFGGGVAFINREDWKVNRKFFIQSMKERLAMSVKDLMTGSLYDSMNLTVEELTKKKGDTVNIIELLMGKCNNIMRLTLFGETGISEERVREINERYAVMMTCFTGPNMLPTGNFAKYLIFPLTSGYKEAITNLRAVEKIMYEIIDEHKSTYDEGHLRDIIDDYIRERSVRRSKGDPTAQYFTDKALMSSLIQILGDGVFSVAAFTGLFFKALLDHPEEQDKIFKELVEVVGLDRQPMVEDKSRLTYTNAFIQEALRTSDFIPFFPSMECTKETTLRGYRIPKGAITLMNSYSSHYDPDTYEDPHKFDPTRYIVAEGKRKSEPVVTFGMGKRACIGESFTMMQVFLFVTTLVKNFRISLPEGCNDDIALLFIEGKMRIVVQPRNN